MGEGQPTMSPPPTRLFHPGDLGGTSELGDSRGAFSGPVRPEVSSGSATQTYHPALAVSARVTQGHAAFQPVLGVGEALSWAFILGSEGSPGPAIHFPAR